MRFHKYHGAGNDFVVIEDLAGALGPAETLPPALVAALCDRHAGVGADGVIRVIAGDRGALYRMDYYNAEGLPAGMCGNGIRCLASLERKSGRFPDGPQTVDAGARLVQVESLSGSSFRVDMGEPKLERQDVPVAGRGPALRVAVTVDGESYTGTGVNMGNPHFVLFASDLGRPVDDGLVRTLGPRLEHHPDFPERTNVEFVDVASPTRIRVRIWERGVGETMASGSGGSAAAVAAAALERTGPHVRVEFPGGELEVDWAGGRNVYVSGPAEEVFSGEIDAEWLGARGLGEFAALVSRT